MVGDPGMTSSWSPLTPSLLAAGFGSTIDGEKLEKARMMLRGMACSKAIRQDEDGDTWVDSVAILVKKKQKCSINRKNCTVYVNVGWLIAVI